MLAAKIYAHARDTLDKTAIVFNGRTISYRVFASLIESSRQYLAAQGVGGEGVAVLPTGSILNTWILGLALRSRGLTTLAIDARDQIGSLGLPEIRYVVAVAGDHPPGLDRLYADSGWRFVSVPPDILADDAAISTPNLPPPVGPFGGHILLTSGTTGAYKKVLFDPGMEAVYLPYWQRVYGISSKSVVNALSFGGWTGIGYRGPLQTWALGGTVVIHQGPDKWDSFSHVPVTYAHVTPRVLLDILGAPLDALRRNDRLRLFVGGGPLSELVYQAAKARLTTDICTVVGTTEAGTYAITPIRQADDLRWHRIAPSCDVQVVDEDGKVLPAGREGRVRVRVVGSARGYLHDEANSRAFFGDGYFYPGDLGVFRSDGRLSLRGRVTEVINIGGSKVAASPIEEALQRTLGVTGVCVLPLQNRAAEEEIHVMIETPRELDKSQLEAALQTELRDARISAIHFIEALPRNHMGKIQRDVLASMISSTVGGNRHQRRLARKRHKPARF